MKNKKTGECIKYSIIIILSFLILAVNIFLKRFEVDLIFLTIFIIGLFSKEFKTFIFDWIPVVFTFWIYEFTRAYGHQLAQYFNRPVLIEQIIKTENALLFFCKDIPTVLLQNALYSPGVTKWYDHILFFFYTSFFWYWILAGYIIWKYKRKHFKKFIYGLIGFSLFDNLIYFLYPTAPPWYASEHGFLQPLDRILWKIDVLPKDTLSTVEVLGQNPFAALPSHHTAWPIFTSLYLIKLFGKKAIPTLIIPAMIIFSIIYGAEHYVVDVLAGILIAIITYMSILIYEKKFKTKMAKK